MGKRYKNALTEYYVADFEGKDELKDLQKTSMHPLANFISNVEAEANDETEDYSWYDGDGTLNEEIISARPSYTVEGQRSFGDEAQDLIVSKEFESGDDRYIAFMKVDPNGDTFLGQASLSEIVSGGGEAHEYGTFGCKITWAEKPIMTPHTEPTGDSEA
ncbi:MAG: phage tail protein [Aerococcus suis]|nr:phage tail protein [Aerococcus suis]